MIAMVVMTKAATQPMEDIESNRCKQTLVVLFCGRRGENATNSAASPNRHLPPTCPVYRDINNFAPTGWVDGQFKTCNALNGSFNCSYGNNS